MTEVFVKKVGQEYQLWISSRSGLAPAGPRLLKGTTRSYVNGPPDFQFRHTAAKAAYLEAERLQVYLSEVK